MNYAEWKREYLWKGKAIPIYLLLINFIIFAGYTIVYHSSLIAVIFGIVGMVSSYAVFTDLYAHLWTFHYSNISLKEWLYKFTVLRTHDVYGIAFSIIAGLGIYMVARAVYISITFVFSIISLYCIVVSRFYH